MANRRLKIEAGEVFGRLTVVHQNGVDTSGKVLYLCACSCGKTKSVVGTALRQGKVKSCGCLKSENARNARGFHGHVGDPIYIIWSNMLQRCNNPKSTSFTNYGARGIKVCDSWLHFTEFYNWAVVSGYKEGLSLERKDVNKDYTPNNCTWIPLSDQCLNKQNTIRYKGKCLSEYCKSKGLNYHTVHSRVAKLGWSLERALSTNNSF